MDPELGAALVSRVRSFPSWLDIDIVSCKGFTPHPCEVSDVSVGTSCSSSFPRTSFCAFMLGTAWSKFSDLALGSLL